VFDTGSLQIVILVTKAVGDFLGTRGIADETIRFNGYPILEKEEHGIDVPGQCSVDFYIQNILMRIAKFRRL
jgi:hypothetical protein